jgi:hypothetical protein
MRVPRVSFTILRMLVLIAILALLLGWAYDRYVRPGYAQTYYVGDLIRPDGQVGVPADMAAALMEQAALLKSSVTPDVWWLWWLTTRWVDPLPTGSRLIVCHTEEGHKQVADWLRQRRRDLHRNK